MPVSECVSDSKRKYRSKEREGVGVAIIIILEVGAECSMYYSIGMLYLRKCNKEQCWNVLYYIKGTESK